MEPIRDPEQEEKRWGWRKGEEDSRGRVGGTGSPSYRLRIAATLVRVLFSWVYFGSTVLASVPDKRCQCQYSFFFL